VSLNPPGNLYIWDEKKVDESDCWVISTIQWNSPSRSIWYSEGLALYWDIIGTENMSIIIDIR